MNQRNWIAAMIATAGIAACSSTGSTSNVSSDQAASDAASAFCARINACSAAFLKLSYGDVATCTARFKLQIAPSLSAPDTAATPAQYEACANALPGTSCDELLTRSFPTDCRPKAGTRANGKGCGDDAQCASTYCKKIASNGTKASCGTCAPRAVAGGACDGDDDCDFGLGCTGSVCVKRGASGDTCDAAHPCKPALACKNGTCATAQEAGQTCDPIAKDCDEPAGLYCPAQKVCTAVQMAGAGQPCGLVNGAYTLCSAGGTCKLAALQQSGTCLATAADGAACDDVKGPTCLDPAVCTNGVCKLPDPTSCN